MAAENSQERPAWQIAGRIQAFVPPDPSLGEERSRDLPTRAQRLLTRAQRWIERGEAGVADRTLQEALFIAPDHPELLRLRAVALHLQRRYTDAVGLLRRAASLRPDDALIHNNLGSALGESGDFEGARDAFRTASQVAPDLAVSWFNLGKSADALLDSEAAHAALSRALEIDPSHQPARILDANVLKTLGRLDEAAAQFRKAIETRPDEAEAWAGLIGMKSAPATAEELATLAKLHARANVPAAERGMIGYAYALALESHQRYAEAFETTASVNALRRKQLDWDAEAVRRVFENIAQAFDAALPEPEEPGLGAEVIFLVGMPRSGSTLAEQILAAHPDVQGAGELGDLPAILREESSRRGVDFPAWVADATAADWSRLGREYLARTARWRRSRAHSTDKNLQNWQLVGAIRAMLPGAHIVDCRRDPVETCWSSLKHQFARDLPFTYDVAELASYWRDYDALMRRWQERFPGAVLRHDYEALIANPESAVRTLLDYCGLPFAPSCLRFHEIRRDVRTASAGQVRTPLYADSARADKYGPLLDPLRRALGVA
jgi:Tfp pilus assembly protein PilF